MVNNSSKPTLAIIGAGPAGCLVAAACKDVADVTVFEKSSIIGGQWAFNETTLTNDGRHSSMYNGLWSNAPKEVNLELPDHPFPEDTTSFPKRKTVYEYLKSYVNLNCKMSTFHFNTTVKSVEFADNLFTVVTTTGDEETTCQFDYVAVATGHFTTPNEPHFDNEESFPGEIIHSHLFTDAARYVGKRILAIGGSYSAEDIAYNCWKRKATCADISHRRPVGFGYDLPEGMSEFPILKRVDGKTVTFDNGATKDYDVIIKATGYLHNFPFMADNLKLATTNRFVPDELYNQLVLIKCPQLFYIGMQNQVYSYNMFQMQGFYIRDILAGKLSIPNEADMQAAFDADRKAELSTELSVRGLASLQSAYMRRLAILTESPFEEATEIAVEWAGSKAKDMLEFRHQCYQSLYTGKWSVRPNVDWINDFE